MPKKLTIDDFKDRFSSPCGKFTPPKRSVKKPASSKPVKKGQK